MCFISKTQQLESDRRAETATKIDLKPGLTIPRLSLRSSIKNVINKENRQNNKQKPAPRRKKVNGVFCSIPVAEIKDARGSQGS
jgi:hypothetical protein